MDVSAEPRAALTIADDHALANRLTPPDETRPASALRVAAALAQREGPRLFRSRVFIVGAALTLLIQVRMVVGILRGEGRGDFTVLGIATAIPLLLLLFVLMSITAMRDRRHDTEELFGTAPAPASARTGALMLSAGWAILGVGAVALPFLIWATAFQTLTLSRSVVVLEFPITVACVVALGVMLGKWVPFVAAGPVLAVLMLGAIGAGLTADTRGQFFGLWLASTDSLWALGWHMLYLVGVAGLAAGLALLRDGIRRGPTTLAVLCLGLAIGAGVLQLPDSCHAISEGARCVWR